ncbi:MAG TPA: penicillin acylase family protein, partial [Vicinamibacterales bacterium]|nr:penicillin acylase family protein [Vicinamibacterales bacterium]
MRKAVRILLIAAFALAVALGGGAYWLRSELRASLPVTTGSVRVRGLQSAVTVERDALGIPTIRGISREDVARATGFVHAQDRFFQMDLARRRASGELAALVGDAGLRLDREVRVHRFRDEARRTLALLAPRDRTVLEAYTAGVNRGLAVLRASPFEYLILRQTPQPWAAEDSLLVVLSMFVTLQDSKGVYESMLATMHDVLPPDVFDLLAPRGTEWDSPMLGEPITAAGVPGPEIYNLRRMRNGRPEIDLGERREVAEHAAEANPWASAPGDAALGSNSWAVSRDLTANGRALVANDMHLDIRVPNTWYRAMIEWRDDADSSQTRLLEGLTLPGHPSLVVGSNTHIAWGFTNAQADTGDLVLLELDPMDPNRYWTPWGWQTFEHYIEKIEVMGGSPVTLEVRWTIWGPVLGTDHKGRLRAYAWTAHSAERLSASVSRLEEARTLEEALDAANSLGTPAQNIIVADRSGRIGWTIYGSLPRRIGLDGRLPESWADGWRGWNGWLTPAEYPRIVDPPGGRLWTANARVVDGTLLRTIGDGNYDIGARAREIRDRLRQREQFSAPDMLDIQLDARSTFLSRWRDLILRHLTTDNIAGDAARARFRDIVEKDWTGEASPDSAAYRLTRVFRDQVIERVTSFVLAECYEADPSFDYTLMRRREGAIWKLVTERPAHLLNPRYGSWGDLLTAAIDALIQEAMDNSSGDLARKKWSDYNVISFRHPLSGALPFISRWLDMPAAKFPGDLFTPRVHWNTAGASQRMVVSPGNEREGIMHMPTGQSGHPLSPFYRNSHDAWARGEPTPFLPGPTRYTLTL